MDYDTIKKRNPKIIYANLTGFGPEGPDSDLPGWDSLAYFARSGVTYMLSRPESKLRHGVVWYLPTGWETKDSFGSRVPRSVD
jgi:crotonobetainyl-CoA:carnitine CoA-transferase CaiB-like acyl-CoA transferase